MIEGRSTSNNVLSLNRRENSGNPLPPPIGHERILCGCKAQRLSMVFVLLDGERVVGEITQFDRWSITIRMENDNRRTIYKHAIKYFEAA